MLVSGSQPKKLDSVACLRRIAAQRFAPAFKAMGFGVAFNPYFPDKSERQRERTRLKQKLASGARPRTTGAAPHAAWIRVRTHACEHAHAHARPHAHTHTPMPIRRPSLAARS